MKLEICSRGEYKAECPIVFEVIQSVLSLVQREMFIGFLRFGDKMRRDMSGE
jgi:hypothetical protein